MNLLTNDDVGIARRPSFAAAVLVTELKFEMRIVKGVHSHAAHARPVQPAWRLEKEGELRES